MSQYLIKIFPKPDYIFFIWCWHKKWTKIIQTTKTWQGITRCCSCTNWAPDVVYHSHIGWYYTLDARIRDYTFTNIGIRNILDVHSMLCLQLDICRHKVDLSHKNVLHLIWESLIMLSGGNFCPSFPSILLVKYTMSIYSCFLISNILVCLKWKYYLRNVRLFGVVSNYSLVIKAFNRLITQV